MSPLWTVGLSCLFIGSGVVRGDDPLEARGDFVPARRAAVTAVKSGRVVEVMVREGRLVKKGEVLFRLDTTLAEGGLRQAEARVRLAEARVKLIEVLREEEKLAHLELSEAQADVKRAEFELAVLRDNKATRERLVKANEEVRLSKVQLERKKLTVGVIATKIVAQRATTEAEIELRKAELLRARIALDSSTIRAPIDGVAFRVNVREGEFTNPALHGLATASVLCEIADPGQAHVVVEVAEADIGRVEVGQPVTVRPVSQPAVSLKGRVETISPIVERGSVRVTALVPIEGKRVSFGASASVRFLPKP